MYPQTLDKTVLAEFDRELSAINDALRVAVLAVEVERATIGQPGQSSEDDLQAVLGLGVLLNDLQVQRSRTLKLTRALPSPNQAPENLRDGVAALGHGLFEVLGHIRNIQKEVYRLARLNMRSAAHKIVSGEKRQELLNACSDEEI